MYLIMRINFADISINLYPSPQKDIAAHMRFGNTKELNEKKWHKNWTSFLTSEIKLNTV